MFVLLNCFTCGHLEGHAGGRPDVRRRSVAAANQDLQRAVLPRLDILREVVVLHNRNQSINKPGPLASGTAESGYPS